MVQQVVMIKKNSIAMKMLNDYNSVSGYISREERSRIIKEEFGLSHGKHKSKKNKKGK